MMTWVKKVPNATEPAAKEEMTIMSLDVISKP